MQPSVTIVIKTFERPQSLKKLLNTLNTYARQYPIIVADDSKISAETAIKKQFPALAITWLNLPFDTGLSAGRNALVNNVQTDYFLLCDDDFKLDERADIERAVKTINENKLDILGGDFYNYVTIPTIKRFIKLLIFDPWKIKMYLFKNFETNRYLGTFRLKNESSCELLITNKNKDELYYCDLVNNFFIGKTSAVKKMGAWDPELKMGEHEDFFYRAKQHKLVVAYLPGFGTGHFPVIKSNYKKYRLRASQYKSKFVLKHQFKSYIEIQTDSNKVLFEYNQ
jgi:glycosyltransferase involved in cell wall biosynthesis